VKIRKFWGIFQNLKFKVRKFDRKNPPPPGGFLFTMFPDQEPCVRDFTTRCDRRILPAPASSLRPAPGPARSFKKRARRRLKAWMSACAPNVLHAARLGICRYKAGWAAAGTLPDSPATITGPWRTRRIFANCLQGTNFWPLNLRFLEDSPKVACLHVFQGQEENQNF